MTAASHSLTDRHRCRMERGQPECMCVCARASGNQHGRNGGRRDHPFQQVTAATASGATFRAAF